MSRDVVTLKPTDELAHATRLMALHRIRHLPVVDVQAHLVGIVSATDVFHAVPLRVNPFSAAGMDPVSANNNPPLRVADVMSTNLATTSADAPIESAAATMHDRKIGALPVVRNGALVGVVTESDILRAFSEILTMRDTEARITFDISGGEDVVPLLAGLTGKHKLRLITLISLLGRERSYCVVRIAGNAIDAMLEELWKSGHRVESVVRN